MAGWCWESRDRALAVYDMTFECPNMQSSPVFKIHEVCQPNGRHHTSNIVYDCIKMGKLFKKTICNVPWINCLKAFRSHESEKTRLWSLCCHKLNFFSNYGLSVSTNCFHFCLRNVCVPSYICVLHFVTSYLSFVISCKACNNRKSSITLLQRAIIEKFLSHCCSAQ